jgi:hypothetical protein
MAGIWTGNSGNVAGETAHARRDPGNGGETGREGGCPLNSGDLAVPGGSHFSLRQDAITVGLGRCARIISEIEKQSYGAKSTECI